MANLPAAATGAAIALTRSSGSSAPAPQPATTVATSFTRIVGHYAGCTWPVERIYEHLHQFPHGIGEKYIGEGRLALEVSRSFRKWAQLPPLAGNELAQWTSEWMTKATQPETVEEDDPELRRQDELTGTAGVGRPGAAREAPQKPQRRGAANRYRPRR